MSFPKRQAAVVGVYTTEQARRLEGRTSESVQLEAILGALDDAGLSVEDVDCLAPMRASHLTWAEQFGERPVTFIQPVMAQGGVAHAAAAIAAGMCNVAVVFHGKAGYATGPGGVAVPTKAPRVEEWSFGIAGATFNTWYALWAQRYMHEFGVTSEDLAEVAVVDRYHATLNPESIMGSRGEITVDDVLASPMICSPLHRLDCSLDNDGGYAIVIASQEVARDCAKPPVWVLGGVEACFTDLYVSVEDPWFPETGKAVRLTADRAFEMAGVSRDEIDVAGLYDCYTITLIRDLEEMGFCELGEGAHFVKEGHTRLGGRMPTNTDGGLLSNSHNGNPSGMNAIEVVRQLRGECDARQVPGASIGISLGQGYHVHGLAATVILGSD